MSRRRVIAVLTILSLSLLVGPAWAGLNTWTASGPTGGAIRAVLVEDPTAPSASSTVYVGTLGSGVFKSINGGDTWVQSGLDGFNIRALVRDPATLPTPTLYAGAESGAGGAPGGVFSSQNGGTSWTPVDDAGLINKKVQALALDGSTLYAGTAGGGVFMLAAGTWTQVNTGLVALPGECSVCPLQVLSLATDSRTPGIVYAGTEGAGLYKSSNSGASWARHPTTTNQGFRSDCLEKAEILAVRVDETQMNETLYVGAKGSVGNSGCSTIVNQPGVGQGPGFFRFVSTDPLWDRKMNGMYGDQIPPTFTLNIYAITMIGIRIYIGTDFGVFTSDDRAQSWDGVPRMHGPPVPSDLVGLPIRALAGSSNGAPTPTTTLYAGSVGRGMFKREHTGGIGESPWIEKNSGLTALRAKSVAVVPVVAQPGQSRVLAGLSSGGIIKSDDRGVTWLNTTETPPPTHYPAIARTVNGIAVDPSDLTTVYAATGRGVIRSTNRGDTWTPASSGLPTELNPPIFCTPSCDSQVNQSNFTVFRDVKAIAVDPANLGVLYAAVGGVHTSVDGGVHWVALNGTPPGTLLPGNVTSGDGKVSAFVVDPNFGDPIFGTLYAATDGFGVFRSLNGGLSWTATTLADQSITALFLDPLPIGASVRLFAGTSTGRLYRSDNGSNWTQLVTNGLPAKPITTLAIRLAEPTIIYASLSGEGVYYSTDNGTNWQVLDNAGLNLDVASLAVDATQSEATLYAATLGRGMHDFTIHPVSAPLFFLHSPEAPYPFETSTPEVSVTTSIGGAITTMLWSTNRGHAGTGTLVGADVWTASAVPLETGLNLITLTAVDAISTATSTSLTVNLSNPAPEIFVDPLTLSFGTVPAGSATAVQNVTVRNDGTVNLILGTITLGGANPSQFKQPAVSDFCSGQTLAPTGTCMVGVKFRPSIVGPQSATLVIPSNDSDQPTVTVTLGGTGGASGPEIFVDPLTLSFGTVPPGSATAVQNVTVRNDGTANLVLGTITLGGANPEQFKQPGIYDFCSGHTLAPLATCTVGVKFRPTSGGAQNATLVIPSNDSDEATVTVTLGGTGGGPEIFVDPVTLPFGSVPVGTVTALQSVTVRNDGSTDLILGTAVLGGANPNQFKMPAASDSCSGQTLGPAATCTVSAKFRPTSPGAQSATIVVPSNDFNEPSVTVTLGGTGE